MRNAVILSVVAHLGILAWGLVSLSSARTLKTPEVRPLPVDLVSVSDLDRLRKGTRKAKTIEDKAGKTDKPKKVKHTRQAKAKNMVRRRAVSRRRIESKKTAALAATSRKTDEADKRPKKKKAAEKKKPVAKKAVKRRRGRAAKKPVKRKKPKKATRTASARKKGRDFEPDKIHDLLNKTRKSDGGKKKADGRKSLGTDSDREDVHMTQSEIAALYARISGCWDPSNSVDGETSLPVTVRFELRRDGTLSGRPVVLNFIDHPKFQAAADAARAAVQICAPFDLPKKKYNDWRQVEFTFELKDNLGG